MPASIASSAAMKAPGTAPPAGRRRASGPDCRAARESARRPGVPTRANIVTMVRFLAVSLCLASAAWAQSAADLEAVVTTEVGSFRFEFAPDKAPKHVEQFQKLARGGYYDRGAFHRVILNGIIQGGDPLLKDPKTPPNLWGTGGLNLLASEFSDMKHER